MNQQETLELLVKSQQETIKMLTESHVKSNELVEELQKKINELLAQIAWLNRQLFGRRSERLAAFDPNQLNLFEPTPTPEELLQVEAARTEAVEMIDKSEISKSTERRNRKLLEGLPVVSVVIEPENVNHDLYKCIGQESTRTLEFEPGKLYVKEIIRPKYGLKDSTVLPGNNLSGVLIAPMPLLPIYKGLPGASMLTEILLQKYEYHVPFYRQVKAFRHLGVRISESTLSGWFKPVCEMLKPLYEELKKEVLASDYIQVDETTLGVINKEKHQASKEYLWMVRSVIKRLVLFHYDSGSRSGKVIENLLSSYKGYLQSDGYNAYNVFGDRKDVCLIACLAHIRRNFEKSLDENRVMAEYALKEIQHLYQIERMADEKELTYEDRMNLRIKLSKPILDSFEKWLEANYQNIPPRSRMGQAIAYAYSLWPRMNNYLKDGRIKIDNNLAENALRPLVLSRKNFLFCGNHEAAENTAVICSLLASCKALDINPREWLLDVIAKLPYYLEKNSNKDLKELLPDRWTKDNFKELQ